MQLESAIKTAQEVTASANREKLRWQEKSNELDVYKQILKDKENLLIARAKELEHLTQVTFFIYHLYELLKHLLSKDYYCPGIADSFS